MDCLRSASLTTDAYPKSLTEREMPFDFKKIVRWRSVTQALSRTRSVLHLLVPVLFCVTLVLSLSAKNEKRSKKRRNFKEAMAATAAGAGHKDLSSLYLGDDDDSVISSDIEDGVFDQNENTYSCGSMYFDDNDVLNFDDILPNWRDVSLPERTEWVQIGNDQHAVEMPAEFHNLATIATDWHATKKAEAAAKAVSAEVQSEAEIDEVDPHVYAQQMRVQEAVRMVQEHPLHESGMGVRALEAKLGISKIELVLKDQFRGKRKKSKRLRKKADGGEDGPDTEDD
eukprot:IDg15428t1